MYVYVYICSTAKEAAVASVSVRAAGCLLRSGEDSPDGHLRIQRLLAHQLLVHQQIRMGGMYVCMYVGVFSYIQLKL